MELGAQAYCSLGLLMTLLHLLMPFKFFGTMLVATFRMLVNDVVKWASVFIFVLLGFSFGIYVLVIHYQIRENVPEPDQEQFPQSVWDSIIVCFKITMGTAKAPSETAALEVMNFGFSIFNSLLLLNLLIAMMSDTYGKSIEGFRMWWMIYAHIVLRYERELEQALIPKSQNLTSPLRAPTASKPSSTQKKKLHCSNRTGIEPKITDEGGEGDNAGDTRSYCIKALEHSEEKAASLKEHSEEAASLKDVMTSLKDVMQKLQELQGLMCTPSTNVKVSSQAHPKVVEMSHLGTHSQKSINNIK